MRLFPFALSRLVVSGVIVAGLVVFDAMAQPADASVSIVRDPELGTHLAVAGDTALYVRRGEDTGDLLCTTSCLDAWQPFAPASGGIAAPEAVRAELASFTRADGARQLAYRGRPLYLARDAATLDASTRGDDAPWSVANLAPVLRVRRHATFGDILVGPQGMTLYTFERDPPGGYECDDACASNFPPLVVADAGQAAAEVPGPVGTVRRAPEESFGPRLQVTYRDRPLYYWSRDTQPGDAGGHGIAGNWQVARP